MANDRDDQTPERASPDEDELVDEQGEESFPASDPPASWGGPDDPRPDQP